MHWKVVFAVIVVCTGIGISDALSFDPIICIFKECCTDSWIPKNYAGLSLALIKRLFGQHLVSEPVVKHLTTHDEDNPHKALVLSLHGSTGTGKTYVSRLIAEKLFYNGMKSKYVHLFSATKDFRRDDKVSEYSDKLREKIENSVKECPWSLFIFDEMHNMPVGIIDTLKPYLDHYEDVDGVDYRRATYIFLSNTGAREINEITFKTRENNKERESITLKEMEQIIQQSSLNATNGLRNSDLILKDLISVYIPFLPLERCHVSQCIRESLVEYKYYPSRGSVPKDKVQLVADELSFFPKETSIFATNGCKRVREKIVSFSDEL